MKYFFLKYTATILGSFLITALFFILEAFTTAGFATVGFPLALFMGMWFTAGICMGIAFALFRDLREETVSINKFWFGGKIIFLVFFGWSWVYLVRDQMPCFLGATGC